MKFKTFVGNNIVLRLMDFNYELSTLIYIIYICQISRQAPSPLRTKYNFACPENAHFRRDRGDKL